MRSRVSRALTAVAALGLVVGMASCGDDDSSPDEPAPGVTLTDTETEGTDTETGGTETPSPDYDGAPAAAGVLEGLQTVATEAGEVDVEVANGSLSLGEVRPAVGWTHTVDEEQPDDIDIDLRSDDERFIELSIDLDDGGELDVKVDYEIGLPNGRQSVTVGTVGGFEYQVRTGALQLGEVRPGDGWTDDVGETEPDEIDVDFRSEDGTTVEVAVEIDD